MTDRPLILLTNDDGYDSPGLLAAAAALMAVGELLIVAPLVQQSGMGRSWPISTGVIHRRRVGVDGLSFPAYAVEGSPAQAVAHALLELAPRRPDLAVAGINFGENMGFAVTSSGTVGAAMEAAIGGVPSMAVSLEMDKAFFKTHSEHVDFGTAAHFTQVFAELLLRARPLPPDVDLLKIDVPRDATPETPWEITRQSRQRYFVALPPTRRELSEPVQVDYRVDPSRSKPGSDVHTLAYRRRISVTPLSVDLTSRTSRRKLRQLLSHDRPSSAA